MRAFLVLGLLTLAGRWFFCRDKKGISDNIQFITLHELLNKMDMKETFLLFIGRLEQAETQRGLDRLGQMNQTVYFLNVSEMDAVIYQEFAKVYRIQAATHFAQFNGKHQFVTANALTVDLAYFNYL